MTVLILWTPVRNRPFSFLLCEVFPIRFVTLMKATWAGTTRCDLVTVVRWLSCGLGMVILFMPGLTA